MQNVLKRLATIETYQQEIRENQREILELLRAKGTRAAYNKAYYAKRKKDATALQRSSKIRNPDRNNLIMPMGKDRRLASNFEDWALVGFKFGTKNKPFQFLEWLCWAWQDVYMCRPVTRSGGYNQLFIGWSNDKPLRVKVTDCDMFANVRRLKFNKIQRDQFADAYWWKWGYGVLYQTLQVMEGRAEAYKELPATFLKPLRLMCGGYGEVEVRSDLFFDPAEDRCDKLATAYAYAKPDLDRGWAACMKGLAAKEEPFMLH